MTGGLGPLNNLYPPKKWDLKILWFGITKFKKSLITELFTLYVQTCNHLYIKYAVVWLCPFVHRFSPQPLNQF